MQYGFNYPSLRYRHIFCHLLIVLLNIAAMNYDYLQRPQKFAKGYATCFSRREQWDGRFRPMLVSQKSRNGISRASGHTSSSQVYNQVPSSYLSVGKQVKSRTDNLYATADRRKPFWASWTSWKAMFKASNDNIWMNHLQSRSQYRHRPICRKLSIPPWINLKMVNLILIISYQL